MKIGFFTDLYLPSGSGVETSIETFRKSLEEIGQEVYIFAPFSRAFKDTNPRVFRFRSLKIIKKPEIRLASPFLPVNSFDFLKKTKNLKLNIVHVHTPFTLGILGKYVASRQKIPILYTHHTQYADYAKFYLKGKILFSILAQALTVWFSNISDGIIAPSYKIKKLLKKWGVKKNIYVLPTGIDTNIFKKLAGEKRILKEYLEIPRKTKLLLFAGRIGKEKNIEFLLNTFKEILMRSKIAINLLIVGDGPYLEELRRISRHLKIDSFVKFTGSVLYKDIPKYYQAADIFVFSSLTDTQGIVILEAMASGLPVVALKDDAFLKIIINNKNGFLIEHRKRNKKEQKIFAQKVLTLLNNKILYKKFSSNACKTTRYFSKEKQAEKLLNIYQKLIKKRNLNLKFNLKND